MNLDDLSLEDLKKKYYELCAQLGENVYQTDLAVDRQKEIIEQLKKVNQTAALKLEKEKSDVQASN